MLELKDCYFQFGTVSTKEVALNLLEEEMLYNLNGEQINSVEELDPMQNFNRVNALDLVNHILEFDDGLDKENYKTVEFAMQDDSFEQTKYFLKDVEGNNLFVVDVFGIYRLNSEKFGNYTPCKVSKDWLEAAQKKQPAPRPGLFCDEVSSFLSYQRYILKKEYDSIKPFGSSSPEERKSWLKFRKAVRNIPYYWSHETIAHTVGEWAREQELIVYAGLVILEKEPIEAGYKYGPFQTPLGGDYEKAYKIYKEVNLSFIDQVKVQIKTNGTTSLLVGLVESIPTKIESKSNNKFLFWVEIEFDEFSPVF